MNIRQRGSKYTPIDQEYELQLFEAYWKSRLCASILGKYKGKTVGHWFLLGQEAWCAYISQDTEIAKKTPSICGYGQCQRTGIA